jgi:hypothetical protein
VWSTGRMRREVGLFVMFAGKKKRFRSVDIAVRKEKENPELIHHHKILNDKEI